MRGPRSGNRMPEQKGPGLAGRRKAEVRRAHPRFAENIRALGAQIEWVEGD